MQGQLVSVNTDDRVRLDGFYLHSQNDAQVDIDAAVIVHGLGGNFYGSRLLKQIAMGLDESGISSVIINTRGHDFLNLSVQSGRSRTFGAACERIDECPYDLNAWCDFLVQQGSLRVALVGHSLGAIKSLYSQTYSPHPHVIAVAGLSATRLSYDSLLASPGGDRFSHWLATTREMVAEQRSDDLVYVDFPFPTWMTAGAYQDKYAAGEKFNWLSFIEQLKTPCWLCFGQLELDENPAFVGLRPDLVRIRRNLPTITIDEIPGADHFYSACMPQAMQAMITWMKQL